MVPSALSVRQDRRAGWEPCPINNRLLLKIARGREFVPPGLYSDPKAELGTGIPLVTGKT